MEIDYVRVTGYEQELLIYRARLMIHDILERIFKFTIMHGEQLEREVNSFIERI